MTSEHFLLFVPDSFLMLFKRILEDLLDIFNGNIGWPYDNFPWADGWFDGYLLIWII